MVGNATAIAAAKSYATTLQGFDPGTSLHGFTRPTAPPSACRRDGVLAGSELTGLLDVKVGDTITLDRRAARPPGEARRARGRAARHRPVLDQRASPASSPDRVSTSYVMSIDSGASRDQMRNTITRLHGVVAYKDADAFADIVDNYLGLFYAFIGVMIALGSVLALAIIYVTMAVNVAERTGELATLRAAGVALGSVARTIATENLVATAIGLPFGLCWGCSRRGRSSRPSRTTCSTLPLSMPWWMLPGRGRGRARRGGVSQLPAVRAVRRVDVAKVVRERSI